MNGFDEYMKNCHLTVVHNFNYDYVRKNMIEQFAH